jgi:hypothetical protein
MGHADLTTTGRYLADVDAYLARHRHLAGTQKAVDDILTWVRRQAS